MSKPRGGTLLTTLRWLAATAFWLVSTLALGAPCAGFLDVESTDAFCPNVDWLKNRAVTLGCRTGDYCPNDPVNRLMMAAFMNRLGTALTPVQLNVEASPGALDLDAGLVVCQAPFVTTGFPRRAVVDVAFSGMAAAETTVSAAAVYSIDNGASWQDLSFHTHRDTIPANRWRHVADIGYFDLWVGDSIKFGVRVNRGGQSGTADLADSRCHLRVLVFSRDGNGPY